MIPPSIWCDRMLLLYGLNAGYVESVENYHRGGRAVARSPRITSSHSALRIGDPSARYAGLENVVLGDER